MLCISAVAERSRLSHAVTVPRFRVSWCKQPLVANSRVLECLMWSQTTIFGQPNPTYFLVGNFFLPPNSAKIRGSSEHASKFILAPFEGPRQRLRLPFQACKSHSTTFEYVDITTRRVYWPWPRLWFPHPRHRYNTLPCPTFQVSTC